MNLLNNLLEFSQNNSSLLSFCQSPNSQISNPKVTTFSLTGWQQNQSTNITSTGKKQTDASLEKRPSSKSVSKMTLFSLGSNLNSNINTKQKLLHKLAHKINMKVRKYYYQFFVLIESYKNKKIKNQGPEKKAISKQNLYNALSKLQQLQQILFSKHFQQYLKKHSLKMMRDVPKKKALVLIAKIFNKKIMLKAYKNLRAFSEYLQKQRIRLDIFSSSMQQIYQILKHQYLASSFINIKRYQIEQQIVQQQILPQKYKIKIPEGDKLQMNNKKSVELLNSNTKKEYNSSQINHIKSIQSCQINNYQFSLTHQNKNIHEISIDTKSSQQYKIYQQLKKNRNLHASPLKVRQPINIKIIPAPSINRSKDSINFLKALKIKTEYKQSSLNILTTGPQVAYQISKRIQADTINHKEIHDLNSKCIFVNSFFDNSNIIQRDGIVQSKVQEYHYNKKLYSQSSLSQLSLMDQFGDPSDTHKGNINKSNRFGSQAVNFKNSLIYERETVNPLYYQKLPAYQPQTNFCKAKQLVNQHQNIKYSSGFQYHQATKYSPQKDYYSNIPSDNKQEKRPSYLKVVKNGQNQDNKKDVHLDLGNINLNNIRKIGSSFEKKQRKQLNSKRNGFQQNNSFQYSTNSPSLNFYKLNI